MRRTVTSILHLTIAVCWKRELVNICCVVVLCDKRARGTVKENCLPLLACDPQAPPLHRNGNFSLIDELDSPIKVEDEASPSASLLSLNSSPCAGPWRDQGIWVSMAGFGFCDC